MVVERSSVTPLLQKTFETLSFPGNCLLQGNTQSLNLWLCEKKNWIRQHCQQTLLGWDAGTGHSCHSPAGCKHLVPTTVGFGFPPSQGFSSSHPKIINDFN